MTVLGSVVIGLIVVGLAGDLTGRLTKRTSAGVWAWINAIAAIDQVQRGHPGWACLNAAACAWMAWDWWNSGGGDDTRRRLRELKTRFTGVRRTAPSAA